MAETYTNIRIILDKLLRHPMLQDLTLESVVDYTVDFMRLVDVPGIFNDKTAVLKVNNYRALLPNDYYEMIQIRDKDGSMFRYATDTFYSSDVKNTDNKYKELTYEVHGGVIYTAIKDGEIEVSYRSIPVDDEGYPLIPDNSSLTKALELYIKKERFTILYDTGLLNYNIYMNTLKEYAWAVGDCQTEFNRLTLDKAEAIANMWNTPVADTMQHSKGFKDEGVRKITKLH